MSVKNANVSARVEPAVKAEAEAIYAALGIPVSTVINMLYRQTIAQNGLPFSAKLTACRPRARSEMSDAEFDSIMARGMRESREDLGIPVDEAFSALRRELDRDGI